MATGPSLTAEAVELGQLTATIVHYHPAARAAAAEGRRRTWRRRAMWTR